MLSMHRRYMHSSLNGVPNLGVVVVIAYTRRSIMRLGL